MSVSDFLVIISIIGWQAFAFLGVRYLFLYKRDEYPDKKMRTVLACMFIGLTLTTALAVSIL